MSISPLTDVLRLAGQIVKSTGEGLKALGKYSVQVTEGNPRAGINLTTRVKNLFDRIVEVSQEPRQRRLESRSALQVTERKTALTRNIDELKGRFGDRPEQLKELDRLAQRLGATQSYARTGGGIGATEAYYGAINRTLDNVSHEIEAMTLKEQVGTKLNQIEERFKALEDKIAKAKIDPAKPNDANADFLKKQLDSIGKLIQAQAPETGFLESHEKLERELTRMAALERAGKLIDALNDTLENHAAPVIRGSRQLRSEVNGLPTPRQANELMLQVETARQGVVDIFKKSGLIQLGEIPEHVLKKEIVVDGETRRVDRTDVELAGEIDRLPMNKLAPSERAQVNVLKEVIEKNLDILNKAADGAEKLKRPAPSDPYAPLGGRPEVGTEVKVVQAKANDLLGKELKALTAGLALKKGEDGEREALRLAYRFDNLLKARTDVRIALGLVPDHGVLDKWIKGLSLDPATKQSLSLRLEDIQREHIPRGEDLRFDVKVGQGGGGHVFSATLDGKDVVVKTSIGGNLDLFGEGLMQGAFHDNPHIPKIKGVYMRGDEVALVMERVRGMDYLGCLAYKREHIGGSPGLDPKVALNCFAGIAQGLEKMHALGLIHSDIKPQNVMYDENTLEPRLIDFGIAYNRDRDGSMGMRGTPAYMAPEQVVDLDRQSPALDVFGMGTTLYELISGVLPNRKGDGIYTLQNRMIVETLPGNFKESCWTGDTKPIRQLIKSCWDKDPENRPTTKQIVQAIKGENVTPARDGEMGLKGDRIDLLNVLKPDSPFRQNVGEATVNQLGGRTRERVPEEDI